MELVYQLAMVTWMIAPLLIRVCASTKTQTNRCVHVSLVIMASHVSSKSAQAMGICCTSTTRLERALARRVESVSLPVASAYAQSTSKATSVNSQRRVPVGVNATVVTADATSRQANAAVMLGGMVMDAQSANAQGRL